MPAILLATTAEPSLREAPLPPADQLLAWVDRRRHLLFGLLVALCAAGFSGHWRLGPDSTLYVSLARSLAAGHGYHAVGWPRGNSHVGLPLMLSAEFSLLGSETFWPMVTLVFLMGLAALALTYRLMAAVVPRPIAVVVTLLTGTSFTFLEWMYELLNEIPALLGMIAALVAFESFTGERRPANGSIWQRTGWAGMLLGGLALAVSLRPATWALMLAMAVTLAWKAVRSPRLRLQAIAILLLVCLALALAYLLDPRPSISSESHERWLQRVLIERPAETLRTMRDVTFPQIFGPVTVRAYFGTGLGWGVSTGVALGLLTAALVASRVRMLWALWVAGTILMLLVYPQPQTRYFLPILPFMALGYVQMAVWLGRRPGRSWGGLAMGMLLVAWLLPNLTRFARLVYLQHSPDHLAAIINGKYVPFRAMERVVEARTPEGSVILSPEALSLEAFGSPDRVHRRFMMPMELPPPDLLPEAEALGEQGKLFAVDTGDGSLDRTLLELQLVPGPPLSTIARAPWEYPPAPERWFHRTTASMLPPLVLYPLRPRTAGSPGVVR